MKRLISVIILLALSAYLYSQDLEYAKTVIQKLASPELKGRGYTENGNLLAAEYISSEYKRIGLLPFGKSYYQNFNISVNTFPNEVLVKSNGEVLKPGIDYLIESSSPSIKGKFNVVKTDRNGIDTKEKFIVLIGNAGENFILVDNTIKSTENNELNKMIDEFISFLKYSPQISCKGVIIYTKEKLTWENSTEVNVRPVIVINKEIDLNGFNSVELKIDTKYIDKCETRNIVGYIKGSLKPDSLIVVTAHYDHLGKMGKDTYFPGANDNASGIAMILNLADYYSKNQPKYSIAFISLAAEEIGLYGAKEFTENPLFKLDKIKFLVNFDLAGTGEEGIRVVNGSLYKDKFDLLTKINTENTLLPKVDIRGAACISDHCLFYQKGVPCFYIYTQGGIKAYHDVYDKYETLPLTEFVDYNTLMIKFFEHL
jgi:aminopeptidase YwaD